MNSIFLSKSFSSLICIYAFVLINFVALSSPKYIGIVPASNASNNFSLIYPSFLEFSKHIENLPYIININICILYIIKKLFFKFYDIILQKLNFIFDFVPNIIFEFST